VLIRCSITSMIRGCVVKPLPRRPCGFSAIPTGSRAKRCGNHPSAGVGHPFSLAFAHIQAAALHHLRRDVPTTFRHAEAALALGAERGFQHLSGIGMILQGWALAAQQCEEGLGLMRQGLAALQATGGMHLLSWFRGALVGLYCDMGQMTEGLATLDEALAVVEAADQRYFEAEIYRLKGG
jgi:predicted ATPase